MGGTKTKGLEMASKMKHLAGWSILALFVFPLCGSHLALGQNQPAPDQPADVQGAPLDDAQWRQGLATWRSQREHELAAPDGWLTLVGLEWLKPGVNSVGAAADNKIQLHGQAPDHVGLFTLSGKPGSELVQLLAPAGGFPPELTVDGQPAREGPLSANNEKPSTLAWRGLTLVVLPRAGRYVLRIKDANSPIRTGFKGLNWYAPNPAYRIAARWIPFTPPHIEEIPTVLGNTLKMPAPGLAEFTLDGQTLTLEPVIEGGESGTLFFILRDATSTTTTYQAARFLHTELPDHGLGQPGELVLDFNRLENPPCAYTVYATCPLPPEKNRLPVALEAGERRYAQ
jgi:uncharacterized protein (DUF1684 family)